MSAWKGTNAYEKALNSFGIDYNKLPTDMNIQVCSYTNQQYEQSAKMFNNAMFGQRYSDVVTLESQMLNTAALVALCVIGPRSFFKYQNTSATFMNEVIVDAVEAWCREGPDATLNSKIIETVSNADVMNTEFAKAFNYLLEEHQAKKTLEI